MGMHNNLTARQLLTSPDPPTIPLRDLLDCNACLSALFHGPECQWQSSANDVGKSRLLPFENDHNANNSTSFETDSSSYTVADSTSSASTIASDLEDDISDIETTQSRKIRMGQLLAGIGAVFDGEGVLNSTAEEQTYPSTIESSLL